MPASSTNLVRGLRRMTVKLDQRLGDEFGREGKRNAPRRTGQGAESIEVGGAVETGRGASCSVEVGEPYMKFQDEGTGVYGPRGTPIRGKGRSGLLAFDWPAAGGLVVVHSVKGSRPTKWWQRTIKAWPRIVRRVSS